MKPTTTREAAYVQTNIKDNSLIKNTPDFAGLFACVTPWGPKPKSVDDGITYDPVFIQDTDTLDRIFGDPRIDPEKYRDLYAVREIVRNGFSVYISKVASGDPASFLCFLDDADSSEINNASLTTDEDGVALIDGYTELRNISRNASVPVLGFPVIFDAVKDKKASKEVWTDGANPSKKIVVSAKHDGDFGNKLRVKVSRSSVEEDGVEIGSLYTVHVGILSGTTVSELAEYASTGATIEDAFEANVIFSCKNTSEKKDTEIIDGAILDDWKELEGGVGNYHGMWKITSQALAAELYGFSDTVGYITKEVIDYWFDYAGCDAFILIPFDSYDPALAEKNIIDAIKSLPSYGVGEDALIAIDFDKDTWTGYDDVKKVVSENKYTVILHGGDDIGSITNPSGINAFRTYPSCAYMTATKSLFGFNMAVACSVYQTKNPLSADERVDGMLGRFLPGVLPCKGSGVDVHFDQGNCDTAKANNIVTFGKVLDGKTRTCVMHSPVKCKYMVNGIDFTSDVDMIDGQTKTRISVVKEKDGEGNPIPFTGGLSIEVSHNKTCIPYAEVVSSITDKLYLKTNLMQLKPKSLKLYAMNITLYSEYDELEPDKNVITSARVSLSENTTNIAFINALNSVFGSYLSFTLQKPYEDDGKDVVESLRNLVMNSKTCEQPLVLSQGVFSVKTEDYINAISEYKNPAYNGCFISELSAMVTDKDGNVCHLEETYDESPRRVLHYTIKQIAADRKDLTCIFTTPYNLSLDDACNWVNSLDKYADLWDYGVSEPANYAEQSFYCEMYWSWVRVPCMKLNNGIVSKTVNVEMSPCYLVIMRGLASYRRRGTFYPVAGEQGGVLPDGVQVISNASTKTDRNKLINHRINPICDLGVLGVQIYGNETLNYKYTDLSAAHIARTLVYIHQQVDRYTNTLTFSLNDRSLWQKWKQYVSTSILAPIYALGGLATYSVAMGFDTTSAELIAQRKINGVIHLQFVPDAEIFTVDFIVDSSANTVESAI